MDLFGSWFWVSEPINDLFLSLSSWKPRDRSYVDGIPTHCVTYRHGTRGHIRDMWPPWASGRLSPKLQALPSVRARCLVGERCQRPFPASSMFSGSKPRLAPAPPLSLLCALRAETWFLRYLEGRGPRLSLSGLYKWTFSKLYCFSHIPDLAYTLEQL